ncbi:hypothetical protein EV363DRAFT_1293925 [Boletus edulis]|nr:hypothetical protein EV363DRAFT_1293925 [Boletus edulis]
MWAYFGMIGNIVGKNQEIIEVLVVSHTVRWSEMERRQLANFDGGGHVGVRAWLSILSKSKSWSKSSSFAEWNFGSDKVGFETAQAVVEIVQPGLEVQVSILGSQTLVAGELQNPQPDMEPEQVQFQAITLFVTLSLYNAEAYHRIHLYETTNINISDGLAKESLAKVVVDYKCTAYAYGVEWKPENTLPNGHTVLTDLSNTSFNNYIIKEL